MIKPLLILALLLGGTPSPEQRQITKLTEVVAEQQEQIEILQGEVSELHEQQQKMSEAMQELYDQCKQEKAVPE